MIILDTDVLTVVQRGESREYERLAERLDTADEDIAVTIISIEEQMRGWLAFIARAKSSLQLVKAYAKLHELLDDFTSRPVIDFDETCTAKFDLLVHAKTRVGTMDLKIAATRSPTMLSCCRVTWRISAGSEGLRVEDWTL